MEVSAVVSLSPNPTPSRAGSVFEPVEARLWLSWRAKGSRDARDRLFEIHGKWAFARAGRYARSRGFDPCEVIGGVAEALLDSICRFDPAKGVRFPAFASPRVSGALCDAGRETLGPKSRRMLYDAPGNEDETSYPFRAGRSRSTNDPLAAAVERETRELLLDAMPDKRSREMARRRFWLGESVDEIGLAMGLGKTVVASCLSQEVLPAARRLLRHMGLGPRARR
jgi:DNA-directed RNA polymerase specialized sigma subunit